MPLAQQLFYFALHLVDNIFIFGLDRYPVDVGNTHHAVLRRCQRYVYHVILILAASRLTFGFQDTDYLKRCFIDTQSFANSIAFGEQIIDNRLSDNTNSGSAAEITFSHITAFS